VSINIEIYRQCHEHLKETDKKRDQILAFYAIIVGIFFGSLDKLKDFKDIFAIVLALLGVLLAIVLIHYRKWHIVYVNSAIALQNLILCNKDLTDTNIAEVWKKLYKKSKQEKFKVKFKRTILSTEFTIFNIFLVISSPTIYFAIKNKFICWSYLQSLLGFVVVLILYVLILNLIGWRLIIWSGADGHKASWILRALKNSDSTSTNTD